MEYIAAEGCDPSVNSGGKLPRKDVQSVADETSVATAAAQRFVAGYQKIK
ncbi:MAG: hypothetical protein SFU21_12035 [Flavihumibacter sp.]|nr:hypothetical protein [Flavihumibacter sp.]